MYRKEADGREKGTEMTITKTEQYGTTTYTVGKSLLTVSENGAIEDLYVAPEDRRKGIATELVNAAVKDGADAALVDPTEEALGFWEAYTGKYIGEAKGAHSEPYAISI